ncbi:MAG: DNA polymerase III subunit beta [Elusimicrobiota bacterium]|nr:DNA polymerase III subunit beta [Elusimicrobiota bacterium]
MKFTCSKNELFKHLQTALLCLSPKTMLPYLSFLQMEAADNAVTITSTDLEVSTRIKFEADVKKKGKALIHGDLFGALMRVQEEKDITIEEGKDSIGIKCGNFKGEVAKGNLQDYPQIPEAPVSSEKSVKVPAYHLSEMLGKTMFSASRDEVRYVLCSVYFEIGKGAFTVVATDGKRLATTWKKVSMPKDMKVSAIVPAKTVNIFQKVLSNCSEKEEVSIIVDDSGIFFVTDNITMSSRLIDGTYPDYKNVIPKNVKIKAEADKDEILNATVRAASIYHSGISSQNSSVKYQVSKNKLNISAASQGFGESEEDIDVESSGGSINIAFNPGFIIDIFKHLDDKKIIMEFSDSLNAVVVKSPADPNYVSLVMPMRS